MSLANTLKAFRILSDGRWHSVEEMQRLCGSRGDRRVRELREPRFGGWDVECVRGAYIGSQRILEKQLKSYWYRIREEELNEFPGKVALLKAGCHVDLRAEMWEGNRPVRVKLNVSEAAFLLGLLTNSAQLKDPKYKVRWDPMWPILSTRIREALPEHIRQPNDLWDEQEDG